MTQSDADLDRLETFLDSERVPEGTMNLSMLDGFLTAIAAGPEIIPPAEWLAMVWGEGGPRFADAAEREEVERLILDRQDQIWRDLAGDPPQCTPIYWLTRTMTRSPSTGRKASWSASLCVPRPGCR